MDDDSIINAAKEYEKSTVFDDIVLKAKGVNSAAGIGFLEGAAWARKRIREEIERLHEEYRGKKVVLKYIDKEDEKDKEG